MPVYFKNTSHSIMIGKDPIEKMGGEEKVTFSMYGDNIPVDTRYFTFTINPTPSNATVTINGDITNTITVKEGSEISYSVSAEGYITDSDTLIVDSNITLDIVLVEKFTKWESNTAGTFTVNIPTDGTYLIGLSGAGGGGVSCVGDGVYWDQAGGGSGSAFQAQVKLQKGSYTAIVGKGGSKFYNKSATSGRGGDGGNSILQFNGTNLVVTYGGKGGYVKNGGGYYGRTPGAGGIIPVVSNNLTIISTSINKTGNKGSHGKGAASGGVSVYNGGINGHGAGGSANTTTDSTVNGKNGYILIEYVE